MSRRRIFVPRDYIRDDRALLPPDQVHHLRHVLRLSQGDQVEIFDGEGNGYTGIVGFDGPKVEIRELRQIALAEDTPVSIVLAPTLIKLHRFEWILQKGTELRVQEFVPLETRLCDIRIPESKIDARLERWERIVREASKQCRRLDVPKIRRPVGFSRFLSSLDTIPRSGRFLLYEKARDRWSARLMISKRLVLCVGPEGGWDLAEVEAAEQSGFKLFSLGSVILRAETAAVAAVTLFRFGTSD